MRDDPPNQDRRAAHVLRYHTASRHRLAAYAPGPEQVDWDTQPKSVRVFEGAPKLRLPLGADRLTPSYGAQLRGAVPPAPVTRDSVAVLLELSFGLSAWKALGPDTWPLRVPPSSGNLHPVEPYVLAGGVLDLEDGLYHYTCMDHGLDRRARARVSPGLWIGLTSIQWREAWKYGLRAFRYCQLDTGHALAALRFAAAVLGWQARVVPGGTAHALAKLLGTDRAGDFAGAEPEDPDVLVEISASGSATWPRVVAHDWYGQASRCDPRAPRTWPGLAEVTEASGDPGPAEPVTLPDPNGPEASGPRAAQVILNRRSARRFTAKRPVSVAQFRAILDATVPRKAAPFDLFQHAPATDLLVWVHKVEGLASGLYALPRTGAPDALRAAFDPGGTWDAAPELPLYRLRAGNFRSDMRRCACHQGIAAEGAATIAMLSPMAPLVAADPWRYRQLHWEAGAIGQALSLAAEAQGLGASGIGCFFDPELHDLLGISSHACQVLYLFAIGQAVADPQILDQPAYPGRSRDESAPLWPRSDTG